MPNITEYTIVPNAVLTWPASTITAVVVGAIFVSHFLWSQGYGFFVNTRIPTFLGYIPFWPAWTFFTRRHDFLQEGFAKVKQDLFQFNVRQVSRSTRPGMRLQLTLDSQHTVVAMRSEAARKVFFGDNNLSFMEGYRILFGGVRPPRVSSVIHILLSFRALNSKTSMSRSKKPPARLVNCPGSKSGLRISCARSVWLNVKLLTPFSGGLRS
jgi:hypothetical protein